MLSQEARLQEKVCDYLRWHYPDVIFRSDFAAGIKMTMGQAVRHKKLQWGRAFPDITIFEPRGGWHGLMIELKPEGYRLYKVKTGEYVTEHVAEQAGMLSALEERGYKAYFACGFEQAREVIDAYLVP